jgi:hypothetical protein
MQNTPKNNVSSVSKFQVLAPMGKLPEQYEGTPPSEFIRIEDGVDFNPERVFPTPKPETRRAFGEWWVRCASGSIVDFSTCYETFMNVNALGNKKCHGCHNCPLGKVYREMHAEGVFTLTRFDVKLQ